MTIDFATLGPLVAIPDGSRTQAVELIAPDPHKDVLMRSLLESEDLLGRMREAGYSIERGHPDGSDVATHHWVLGRKGWSGLTVGCNSFALPEQAVVDAVCNFLTDGDVNWATGCIRPDKREQFSIPTRAWIATLARACSQINADLMDVRATVVEQVNVCTRLRAQIVVDPAIGLGPWSDWGVSEDGRRLRCTAQRRQAGTNASEPARGWATLTMKLTSPSSASVVDITLVDEENRPIVLVYAWENVAGAGS